MFTRFFDTTQVDAFAVQIARELVKSAPPGSEGDGSKKALKKRADLDARIGRQAQTFAQANRPNFYQKAKLGSRLQDELEAAGYSAEVSKGFSYEVAKLVAMAG